MTISMPTINSAGHLIEDIRVEDRDPRVEYLRDLAWPEDMETLWHLAWDDFIFWIHLLNPREAMLMSADRCFVKFRNLREDKGPLARLYSAVWRNLWE